MSAERRAPGASSSRCSNGGSSPGKVRVALSPRITVKQAERLARWPGMVLVIEDGCPWLMVE